MRLCCCALGLSLICDASGPPVDTSQPQCHATVHRLATWSRLSDRPPDALCSGQDSAITYNYTVLLKRRGQWFWL
jgi:hypothetical protein